ncbi:MAG: hypothetical protein JL50_05705 [Peptococcaceae bacterium BICA1-7]|nr:MAG: hypothetical protein JL50_05705 [Peptococcaceae bacterium BICA1-7]
MQHMTHESLKNVENIFRALADQSRLRIARLLYVGGEATVCELTDALCLPQYSVSRNLSILRHAGIVGEKREGAWRYYSISAKPDTFSEKLLLLIKTDLLEQQYEKDLALLKKRLALRVEGKCVAGTVCLEYGKNNF